MDQLSYRRHRFPPPIIQHAIWLYLRFTLSYRDVEELLVATAAAKVALERLASPRDPTAVERRKPSTAEATLPGVPPVQGRADVPSEPRRRRSPSPVNLRFCPLISLTSGRGPRSSGPGVHGPAIVGHWSGGVGAILAAGSTPLMPLI